jgi:DNA-binding NarL/FixJ family response regulator
MNKEHGQSIRALIVSDNHIMRSGLRRILESQSNILVLGDVTVGSSSTVDALIRHHPDIILIDLDPHSVDVLDFIRNVQKTSKDSVILVLSDLGDDDLTPKALSLGARGVVLKVQPPSVLIAAIQGACRGDDYHSESGNPEPEKTTIRGSEPVQKRIQIQDMAKINSLTTREREIIRLIALGLKNKDVASRLHISDITVRHHLTSIFTKLEVSDRQKLLILAHRYGIVELTSSPDAAANYRP